MQLGLESVIDKLELNVKPMDDNTEFELLSAHMQYDKANIDRINLQEEYRSLTVALENLKDIYDVSLQGELSEDLINFLKIPLAQVGYEVLDGDNTISSEKIMAGLKKGGVWLKDKLLELLAALIDSIKYMFDKNRRYVAAAMKRIYNYNEALKKINSAKRVEMEEASNACFDRPIPAGPRLVKKETLNDFPKVARELYSKLLALKPADLMDHDFDLWTDDMSSIGLKQPSSKTDVVVNKELNKQRKSIIPSNEGYKEFKDLVKSCTEFDNNTKRLFKDDKIISRIHKQLKKDIEAMYADNKIGDIPRSIANKNFNIISNYMTAISVVGGACTYTMYFLTTMHDKDMTRWLKSNKSLGKDMLFQRRI